jgi:predicted bacteriocin transport accessory protein
MITGCGNKMYDNYKITKTGEKNTRVKTFTNLTYDEYSKKIENKDSFVILLWQTGCSHCEEFEPKLNKIISHYNLDIYGLNLADLTQEQYAKVKNKTFIQGTPTMVYIKEGRNSQKLVGSKDDEEVLEFLSDIGYLKRVKEK